MNLLIDTNILLWLLLGHKKLDDKHRKYLDTADSLQVSIVSFWEISIKLSGKGFDDLVLPSDWHTVFKQAMERFQIRLMDVSIDDCKRIENLPPHHKDPFDRMIIAQAVGNNLAVITSDKVFREYDVEVVS